MSNIRVTKEYCVNFYNLVLEISKRDGFSLITENDNFIDALKQNKIVKDYLINSTYNLLCGAIEDGDEDFVEAALYIISNANEPYESWNLCLCKLLLNVNHYRHEDIISELQRLQNKESIPYLITAINLKPRLTYLDYDDYGSYYKKCLWALTKIGTQEARNAIESFVASEIPELSREANYRLSKFDLINVTNLSEYI